MHLERQRTLCLHVFLINTKDEKSSTFYSVTVGLQSVTRAFRQLQGGTRDCRGLCVVMVWYGYKGSQVTGGVKWLQG